MFKVGDTVVHKHEVCKITEIAKKFRDGEDYYTLQPLSDETLIIRTPVSNSYGLLRQIISKTDAEALINKIPEIKPVKLDTRALANEYKKLLDKGTHENLVRIIKTAYTRKEERIKNKQQASENDKIYFRLAEGILYNELSVALNMTIEEVKGYIVERIESASEEPSGPIVLSTASA